MLEERERRLLDLRPTPIAWRQVLEDVVDDDEARGSGRGVGEVVKDLGGFLVRPVVSAV